MSRTVYPTIPPRVDYALTERGRTLVTPLQALRGWASDNKSEIEASRRAFDRQAEAG